MIIVSACLAGIPCRYDGGRKTDPAILELVRSGQAIPLCPEQLGGLTTPRVPAEIRDGRVFTRDGRDVTEEFHRGAAIVLDMALEYGCGEAILKARSPSCGKGEIYDGTFSGRLVPGDGVTAAILSENGIAVRTEETP